MSTPTKRAARAFITKSRSGHYSATIKGKDGLTICKLKKCELSEARHFVRTELAKLGA